MKCNMNVMNCGPGFLEQPNLIGFVLSLQLELLL